MLATLEEQRPSPQGVSEQLERILQSADFEVSDRNRGFLRYVTREALAGRGGEIKAYTIARDVFGRPKEFDPARDPIVRIEAAKLRKALERYYLTAGLDDPVRIEIPKGGYAPSFRVADARSARSRDVQLEQAEPTIAVLPFALVGEDAAQARFAEGLSGEIAARLSQYRNVWVIRQDTSLDLEKGSSSADLPEKPGARFVLEGLVRRSGGRVRVTVRLTDMKRHRQVWGETYDRALSTQTLFDVEQEIAHRVVEAVASLYGGAISQTLRAESRKRGPEQLSAYEAVLQLHRYNQANSPEGFAEGFAALEHAVVIEPENANAWASLAELRCDAYTLGHVDTQDSLDVALACTRKALSLDASCWQAHFVAGMVHLARRDRDGVLSAVTVLLDRSETPVSRAWAGWLQALIGDWDEGLRVLREELRLIPGHPATWYHAPFLYHYGRREYDAALEQSRRFHMPTLFWDPLDRAAVLGQLGRLREGRSAVDALLSTQPKFEANPTRFLRCFIFQDELVEHVLEGLSKAGLPT